MTDQEYAEFMSYLFERHVRPRMSRLRHRLDHHMKEEVHNYLDRAERSARIFRFIESYCEDSDDVYRTFTPDSLARSTSDVRYSLSFSTRVTEEGGFLDAYEEHEYEILNCLKPEHLPEADKEIIREIGSVNPDVELRSLVYAAKQRMHKVERQHREVSLRQEMRNFEKRLEQTEQSFRKVAELKEPEMNNDRPKKSRRWFKGVGQIAQGSALSIADVALAIGVLKLPVSAETATWGALASVATGIGTILNGIGDLRNE
jgi:ATP-dependent Lon protease